MLDFYGIAKYYYDRGYYTVDDVRIFVNKEKITVEQFKEITNQDY